MQDPPKFQVASDGSLRLDFGKVGGEVEVAAISGDGSRVLTVREVGRAQVWDAHTGANVGEIRPESPLTATAGPSTTEPFLVYIESAALSRDGSMALLGLNDRTAGVFRVADGARLATLHAPDEAPAAGWGVVRAVDYSPDGSLALVGFAKRSVGVWTADGARLVAFLSTANGTELVGPPGVRDTLVSSVAASPDNRWIFGGCSDMTATFWRRDGGEAVLEARAHVEEMLVVFEHEGDVGWATSGGAVWLARRGESPVEVVSSGEHWAGACFHDGAVLTQGYDGRVTVWTLTGESTVLAGASELRPRWKPQTALLAFGPRGETLHAETETRLAVRAHGRTTSIVSEDRIVEARFSPQGDLVAVRGWGDALDLWSVPSGERVRSLRCPGRVGSFAFSPDGSLVAVGELGRGGGKYRRRVIVYETATGKRVFQLREHDWQVSHVAFSPDGRWLASIGDDLVLVRLRKTWWLVGRKTVRAELDRTTSDLRFLPDGRLLVVDRGRARIFDDGQEVASFEVPARCGTCWRVSEDDKRLLVATVQGVIQIDLASGRAVGRNLADIPRFASVKMPRLDSLVYPRFSAAVWRTEYGTFLHQGDGPRGWTEPHSLSPDGDVIVPAANGAAVVRLGAEVSVRGFGVFEGKLRAGRVVGSEVLLVNEAGRLFRWRLEGSRRASRG